MNDVGDAIWLGTVYVAPILTTSLRPTLITPVGAVSSEVTVVVIYEDPESTSDGMPSLVDSSDDDV